VSLSIHCPHCGAEIKIDISSIRKQRLTVIFNFISKEKPKVLEAVIWIMETFGVRRAKAIEYLKDLENTKQIKIVGDRLVPNTSSNCSLLFPNTDSSSCFRIYLPIHTNHCFSWFPFDTNPLFPHSSHHHPHS